MSYPDAILGPGLDFNLAEKKIALNSGMLLVVPAWKITDILMSEDMVAMRKERDAQRLAEEVQEATAVQDVAPEETDGDGISLARWLPKRSYAHYSRPRTNPRKAIRLQAASNCAVVPQTWPSRATHPRRVGVGEVRDT